mgnify:FL=1
MADKKVDIAKSIGNPVDPHADVIDAPVTADPVDYEPTTSEE